MDALPSSSGVISFEGRKDKPKIGQMLTELEIDCRMAGQTIEGGHVLHLGKQQLHVPSWAFDSITAQSWDKKEQSRIDDATDSFNESVITELGQQLRIDLSPPDFLTLFNKTKAKGQDAWSKEEAHLMAEHDKAMINTGQSAESHFYAKHHRGILPFKSVKVLKNKVPMPEQSAKQDQDEVLLSGLMKAVGGLGDSGLLARMDAMEKKSDDRMAALEAENAKLRKELEG